MGHNSVINTAETSIKHPHGPIFHFFLLTSTPIKQRHQQPCWLKERRNKTYSIHQITQSGSRSRLWHGPCNPLYHDYLKFRKI